MNTTPNIERTTGAIADWAASVRDNEPPIRWFVGHAKKTRSIGARDVLAHLATNGRYTYDDLAQFLETTRIDAYAQSAHQEIRPYLWQRGVLGLAQVLYSQRLSQIDLLDALSLYELAVRRWGLAAITNGVDRSYYSDLLVEARRFDEALVVLDYDEKNVERALWHRFLKLNSINPWLNEGEPSDVRWLTELNRIYRQHGYTGIDLRPGTEAPFYRLQAHAPAYEGDMALVSVIMPIFEPDDSTDVAIQSILHQTWRNLELIIVDDGSPSTDAHGLPTDYEARLRRWEATDSRIRLILNEENRGTYWARNTAYSHASGKYVTVADKDDWHHPKKLELQATELEADPSKIANITHQARVDPNMRFLLRWGPDRLAHPSFASLMFRREEVQARLGFWDNVRRAGDGEFKFRLQSVYGIDLQSTEPMPMAFSLMGEGNLTSQDLGLGYVHDDRRAYRWAYDAWHREIAAGASPYLEMEPAERPFPAPNSFLPDRPAYGMFDVVYVSEFGFETGNATILRNEIRMALSRGLRVGIVPMQNFHNRSASARELSTEFFDLVRSGAVTWLPVTATAACKLLIVRWPAMLQVAWDGRSGIEAEQVAVVANHMPYERLGEWRSYDVTQVTSNVRRMFGVEPTWVPESEKVHSILRGLVPSDRLWAFPWKGTVPHVLPPRGDLPDTTRAPVIGRHGRDHISKWPGDRHEFRAAYPVDGSVGVAILGGASVPVNQGFVDADELSSWQVWRFNEISVEEYLGMLDFFVYFHDSGTVEAYGMAILEAMNHGAVCILPETFQPVFGNAAVYCRPHDVSKVVNELWNDADGYQRQRDRAHEYVRTQGSPEAFFNHLGRFGVVPRLASMEFVEASPRAHTP